MKGNTVIEAFAERFNRFKAENSEQILGLETALENRLSEVDLLLDSCADDLKSSLGADAANEAGDDDASQEEAIADAETWVTDNISNGSLSNRIAVVLWLGGCEYGEAKIRQRLKPHTN